MPTTITERTKKNVKKEYAWNKRWWMSTWESKKTKPTKPKLILITFIIRGTNRKQRARPTNTAIPSYTYKLEIEWRGSKSIKQFIHFFFPLIFCSNLRYPMYFKQNEHLTKLFNRKFSIAIQTQTKTQQFFLVFMLFIEWNWKCVKICLDFLSFRTLFQFFWCDDVEKLWSEGWLKEEKYIRPLTQCQISINR